MSTSKANVALQNQLVTWLNEIAMSESPKKVELLAKVQEVLIHQLPQMIPTILDNVLSLSTDRSGDVKKQVIIFIEEVGKNHPDHLPKLVPTLRIVLADSPIAVQKRIIQAASIVYKQTLIWICSSDSEMYEMQTLWEELNSLKLHILNMIDSDNEGIRTNAIKFLESVVTLQTYDETGADEEFSLDDVPQHLHFLKRQTLEEESEHIFALLIKFLNSQHISSVNLMACMTALCNLAKLRPKFMPRVIEALGDLHETLPPTLSTSQVNSVRKHLRMCLITTIKHPSSQDMLPHLTQLLSNIGMSVQEIAKIVPRERRNKRMMELKNGESSFKKPRIDSPEGSSQGSDKAENIIQEEVVNVIATENTLFEGVSKLDSVVNLVMATLELLPDDMPNDFKTGYKPIPNAGSIVQKKNLAKMLLALIKGEPIIVQQRSLSELTSKIPLLKDDEVDEKAALRSAVAKLTSEQLQNKQNVQTAVAKLREEKNDEQEDVKEKIIPPQTPTIPTLKKKLKQLKLAEITKPIPKEVRERILIQSIKRILNAEVASAMGGVQYVRNKLIITFASTYSAEIREMVLEYILEDPKGRIELALMWLYDEFSYMQGFSRLPLSMSAKNQKHDYNYNNLICALITQIGDSNDPKLDGCKDALLKKIYLEAPVITEDAVNYLKHLVSEPGRTITALELLEEIVLRRPTKAAHFVPALLSHTVNQVEEIREAALKSIIKIYLKYGDSVRRTVEKYAKLYLGFIPLTRPPYDLFEAETGRMEVSDGWTDDLYKACLGLVVAVFVHHLELIHDIASIYGHSGPEAKRCILRAMEGPLRRVIGEGQQAQKKGLVDRDALLDVIEECPRGAETFITRIVQIMTEKAAPSKELVSRVRTLYRKQVSDVRFLIPVLNGLEKEEIVKVLPKLVKLNPTIVKEVFNKLLGIYNINDEELPLTPVDLLVELHLIDTSTTDLKYIIKATGMCFADKQTFTQEVIMVAIHTLMEKPEIPVLFMRTVLQSLTLYPTMSAIVIGILQRLISKQVWTNKVLWEGFIKCCERTKPGCYHVLLALPVNAIAMLTPELNTALASHVALMTPQQRTLYNQSAVQMLMSQQQLGPTGVPPPDDSYHVAPVGVPPPDYDMSGLDAYQMDQSYPSVLMPNALEPIPPGME